MAYIPADAEYDFENAPYKSYSVTVEKRIQVLVNVDARDEQEALDIASDLAVSGDVDFDDKDEVQDVNYAAFDAGEN